MSTDLPHAAPSPAAAALAPGEVLVAIDVGGTTTRVGSVSADGPPAGRVMRRLPSRGLGADPVAGLAALVREETPAGSRLAGAAVGLPVCFDERGEVALSSPNLPGFVGRRVGAELARALGAPVAVERDTTLLATGEWTAGAARGARTLCGIFIGTGIGGCFLVDGVPYRGASGGSVEIGHVPIRAEGRRCICGNTDCLEAYASGHVLDAIARQAGVAVAEVFTHPAARAGVADYVQALAHGLAAAVNLLDPEVLVIGGGLHGRETFPRGRLAALVRTHLRAPVPRERVRIVHAALGSEAALHAAPVLLARHRRANHKDPSC